MLLSSSEPLPWSEMEVQQKGWFGPSDRNHKPFEAECLVPLALSCSHLQRFEGTDMLII